MRGKILQPQQQEALSKLRGVLLDLHATLVAFGAAPEDEAAVRQSQLQLDSLFLLVVAGEFNAGKSAFNALLGERILEEGVTPTTSRIHVVTYGSAVKSTALDEITDEFSAPIELLREIHIVDTPGTNAIERHHEAITQKFLPRADIVFFLTSADRPLTESERLFLSQIREWGKKVVMVLNKIDILESRGRIVQQILTFIKESMQRLLGFMPEIFPVAARPALQAKQAANAEALAATRFDKLEDYIATTLDEQERLRLKLLNPLGLGTRTTGKYLKEIEDRAKLLAGDAETIDRIERELKIYQEDMSKGFKFALPKSTTSCMNSKSAAPISSNLRFG